MRQFLALLMLAFTSISISQDTITVQTFTYDSITTRRAIFSFPPELQSMQFEKVLMYYNLKCSPLTTWDSYNCGEWDYLTYSQIWQHTGEMDSVAVNSPQYLVNGESPATVNYVNTPYYHYYQNYQKFMTYSASSDVDHAIDNGTLVSDYPFGASNATQRSQILWTATEIAAALILPGEIAKLRFDVNTPGGSMGHLKVRMKHTSVAEITSFDETGWTTVYDMNTTFPSAGLQTLNLTTPFLYDGTSSILIDISFENTISTGSNTTVNATATTNNTVISINERPGYLNIQPGEFAEVDLTHFDFQNELTIAFWAQGDAGYLPANTSVLEAFDSLNNRVQNIHFPWSDATIYWDAGKGSGYDRIQKAASVSEYEGEWHHWAFTKNATDGTMKIYKDGILWHTESGKNLEAGIVNKFRIGNSEGGDYFWGGKLDEFTVWNTEITQTDIAGWMNEKITPSHPNYANLVLYYDFDNEPSVLDKSVNNHNAMMTTPGMIQFYEDIHAGYTLSNVRPNITFVQGNYVSMVDSVMVMDSVLVSPIDVLQYQVDGKKFTIASLENKWPVGYTYFYDSNGVKLDSIFHPADVTLSNTTLTYYQPPFEVIIPFEIGRYITPYGIGFDLGPNGFTYVYDVTDYQSLLMGDVDFSAHNTQELIDVKFVFVVGTPPRNVLGVQQLWDGLQSYSYSGLDNDINLAAETVTLDPAGDMFKLKTRITGHGHNGSNNCCEWGNGVGREHELLIDGTSRFLWDIWQETQCGDNPNIGQGGTWPYAREGWCPGDKVTDYEFDITPYVTPGSTASIDYDIEDVPTADPAQGNGNYVMSMHMVTYGAPNFSVDAAVVDVLNPNDWEYYSKWNPTCQNPRIILKNTGATTLTSAEINVWVGDFGNNVITYTWTGDLEFLEEEMVEIPVDPHWWNDYLGQNFFTARVYKANGQFDEYENNNQYTVNFEASPVINDPFYVWFKTNNKAVENDIFVRDQDGNVVFSRTDLTNTTEYKDTLDLAEGCYTVEITDSDHDGLGFWYSAIPVADGGEGETSGFLRLKKVGGSVIYVFPNDFGHYAKYSFSVGYAVGIDELNQNYGVTVYPNPTDGNLTVLLDNFTGDEISIQVLNELGEVVYLETIKDNNPEGYWERNLNLDHVNDGIYFVKIVSDDIVHTERIIIH
ncbi:MAG: T9SS type A sorting domain-containing protein [Bacteroidetes bacterium]|nr:T9SS type A sorting domain-containing protein [Bacteroidota bacterium]